MQSVLRNSGISPLQQRIKTVEAEIRMAEANPYVAKAGYAKSKRKELAVLYAQAKASKPKAYVNEFSEKLPRDTKHLVKVNTRHGTIGVEVSKWNTFSPEQKKIAIRGMTRELDSSRRTQYGKSYLLDKTMLFDNSNQLTEQERIQKSRAAGALSAGLNYTNDSGNEDTTYVKAKGVSYAVKVPGWSRMTFEAQNELREKAINDLKRTGLAGNWSSEITSPAYVQREALKRLALAGERNVNEKQAKQDDQLIPAFKDRTGPFSVTMKNGNGQTRSVKFSKPPTYGDWVRAAETAFKDSVFQQGGITKQQYRSIDALDVNLNDFLTSVRTKGKQVKAKGGESSRSTRMTAQTIASILGLSNYMVLLDYNSKEYKSLSKLNRNFTPEKDTTRADMDDAGIDAGTQGIILRSPGIANDSNLVTLGRAALTIMSPSEMIQIAAGDPRDDEERSKAKINFFGAQIDENIYKMGADFAVSLVTGAATAKLSAAAGKLLATKFGKDVATNLAERSIANLIKSSVTEAMGKGGAKGMTRFFEKDVLESVIRKNLAATFKSQGKAFSENELVQGARIMAAKVRSGVRATITANADSMAAKAGENLKTFGAKGKQLMAEKVIPTASRQVVGNLVQSVPSIVVSAHDNSVVRGTDFVSELQNSTVDSVKGLANSFNPMVLIDPKVSSAEKLGTIMSLGAPALGALGRFYNNKYGGKVHDWRKHAQDLEWVDSIPDSEVITPNKKLYVKHAWTQVAHAYAKENKTTTRDFFDKFNPELDMNGKVSDDALYQLEYFLQNDDTGYPKKARTNEEIAQIIMKEKKGRPTANIEDALSDSVERHHIFKNDVKNVVLPELLMSLFGNTPPEVINRETIKQYRQKYGNKDADGRALKVDSQGIYDDDIKDTNISAERILKEQFGIEMNDADKELLHLLGALASGGSTPERDTAIAMHMLINFKKTGELVSRKQNDKIENGKPVYNKDGTIKKEGFSSRFANDSLNKFKKLISGRGIEDAFRWMREHHAPQEIADTLGIELRKVVRRGNIDSIEGGLGVFGVLGKKQGSYFLNRISSLGDDAWKKKALSYFTADSWRARLDARIIDLSLLDKNGKIISVPMSGKQGKKISQLIDQALTEIGDELGLSLGEIQQYTWAFEKKLYQTLGGGNKMTRNSKGVDSGYLSWLESERQVSEAKLRASSAEPEALYQRDAVSEDSIKGAARFEGDARPVMTLFTGKSDFSTILHESAHIFRKSLSERQLSKLAQLEKGLSPVEIEEMFARGFERYFAEGKAPLPELRDVYRQFSGWMLDIYGKIKGTPIEQKINPRMRTVFDQMMRGGNRLIDRELLDQLQKSRPTVPKEGESEDGLSAYLSPWNDTDSMRSRWNRALS